jgi:uracil-DNA glycosylase family 4
MLHLDLDIENKIEKFDQLCGEVTNCFLCPRMFESARILNRSVGNLKAEIMFIGEAPGRLGADNSGIPFHGDQAGHNFENLLEFAKLDRNNIYVTNAVLCNPKDEKGNNATPVSKEITNCNNFLKRQIDLVDPKIIVTLGAKSLLALNEIEKHNLNLKDSTRSSNNWYNRILIPCYHPGQRAMIHRSMANQRSDYQFINDTYKSLNKKRTNYSNQRTNENTSAIIEYILKSKGSINYFALHKLFYLIEYNFLIKYNTRITNSYFVRQKDGPYCTDLHVKKLQNSISDLNINFLKNGTIIIKKDYNKLFVSSLLNEFELDEDIKEVIDFVLKKYGSLGMSKLKNYVYLSRPMRNILFLEKEKNINLYNSPIEFNLESIY